MKKHKTKILSVVLQVFYSWYPKYIEGRIQTEGISEQSDVDLICSLFNDAFTSSDYSVDR
jgi:hypothetical protein